MAKKIDKYIFSRLLVITLFVIVALVIIFIVIDFSENSEDFTDKGATFAQIFGVYYLNYIPEMVRLITPVAAFIACLYLTGQMTERLEIIALKAAGISLYRLLIPYLIFASIAAISISYLDGFVIPDANENRITFESKYLRGNDDRVDRNQIFRQESEQSIFKINYFNPDDSIGHRVEVTNFKGDSISKTLYIQKIIWQHKSKSWKLENIEEKQFTRTGYKTTHIDSVDTTLNILPRDLARKTSDVYQLTYPEAESYIASIERSGAGNVDLPKIQLYGRYAYPFSIIVVMIVGFALASVKRSGGKGFYIAAGLAVSFLYLVMMKVIEPFGGKGEIDPLLAAALPHLIFLVLGVGILLNSRK
ncbi:LptF/LptG family permease [Fodinibius halophilus]|uniref:YjgP/YjgQ family permease n=1 Tax=Fodinibius halophilus TaxID=1736908 RepID=A0A6M1SYT5_9BACT|nr:YjgP/YjgQ family permease [Fodinibius halophilus]